MKNQLYFRRLMISFSVITLLVSVLYGINHWQKKTEEAVKQYLLTGDQLLEHARAVIQHEYFDSFKNVFISDVLSVLNPISNDPLLQSLSRHQDFSMYQIHRMIKHLQTTINNHDQIENISIYFHKTGYILDRYSFYPFSTNSPKYMLLDNVDQLPLSRWFMYTEQHRSERIIIEENMLTYIYPFPFQAHAAEADGFMLIDLPLKPIIDRLNQLTPHPGQKLVMVNVQDQSIIGSKQLSIQDHAFIHTMITEPTQSEHDVKGSFIHTLPLEEYHRGWLLVYLQPEAALIAAKQTAIWQSVQKSCLVFIIGLFFSYFLANQSYRPIKQLLDRMGTMNITIPSAQHNEFTWLGQVVLRLQTTVQKLNSQLEDTRLLALFHGHTLLDELPPTWSKQGPYQVVLVRLTTSSSKEHERWIQQLCKQDNRFNYRFTTLQHEVIALLCYPSSRSKQPLQQNIADFFLNIPTNSSHMKLHTETIAIGGIATTIEDVHLSFRQAQYALSYTFLFDEQQPVYWLDYEQLCERTEWPEFTYDQFDQMLRSGQVTEIKAFLTQFELRIRNSHMSLEAVELSLLQLNVVVSRVMVELNQIEVGDMPVQPHSYTRPTSLCAAMDRLQQYSLQIAHAVTQRQAQHPMSALIGQLKAYIDDHLDEDISLDRLAQIAGLSPQYISSQFKEVLQVSFLEYLNECRMQKACELLLNPTLTVTKVSGLVGFQHVQYFCTRFKKRYHVTPNQYRQSFRNENVPAHT